MTSLDAFDPLLPREKSRGKASLDRSQYGHISSHSRSDEAPDLKAVYFGDKSDFPKNLSAAYKITIEVDGTGALTVDMSTSAQVGNIAAVLLSEAVAAINFVFTDAGKTVGGKDIGASGSEVAIDSDGYLMLRSTLKGTAATLDVTASSDNEASEALLGTTTRNGAAGLPINAVGGVQPAGTFWLETTPLTENVRLKQGTGARIISAVDYSDGPVDLSSRPWLRISVDDEGPFDIDCSVTAASPSAVTLSDVVTDINAAFTGTPASAADGKFLKIESTVTTVDSSIVIGALVGGAFLGDDGTDLIVGLPRGDTNNTIYDNFPHTFKNQEWSEQFIRGTDARPGIGVWGAPLFSKDHLPASSLIPGELRIDESSGVPWIFSDKVLKAGWRRAIPAWQYPLIYDRLQEAYILASTSDSFLPQPFSTGEQDSGKIGQVVTLVDASDSDWQSSGINRDINAPLPRFDNFDKAPGALHNTLGVDKGVWHDDSGGGTWQITTSEADLPAGAGELVDRYASYSFAAGKTHILAQGDGVTTVFAVGDFAQPGEAILAETSYFSVEDSETTYQGRGDAGGAITGGGITSGTVVYGSGDINITFSVAPPDTKNIYVTYTPSSEKRYHVAAELKVSSTSQAGANAKAGLIFGMVNNDFDNCYVIKINDDGTGEVVRRVASVETAVSVTTSDQVSTTTLLFDPPLDSTLRTLRVSAVEVAGLPFYSIFWNGSSKSSDWDGESILTGSTTTPGVVANEFAVPLREAHIGSFLVAGGGDLTFINHTQGGIMGHATTATESKSIQIEDFQIHAVVNQHPGLPPVSGARLRDTLGAVQVDGQTEVVSDCTPETPLVFKPLTYTNESSVQIPLARITQDPATKILTFDVAASEIISTDVVSRVVSFSPATGEGLNTSTTLPSGMTNFNEVFVVTNVPGLIGIVGSSAIYEYHVNVTEWQARNRKSLAAAADGDTARHFWKIAQIQPGDQTNSGGNLQLSINIQVSKYVTVLAYEVVVIMRRFN